MERTNAAMRLGFIEPHLERYGGIRRMVEFANRLVARGHDVTFFLPDEADQACRWMRCGAKVVQLSHAAEFDLDVVLFNQESQWHDLDRFRSARRRIFYALHYSRLYEKRGSWDCLRVPVDLQLANSGWTADMIAADIGHRPTVLLGGSNRDMFRPYGGTKRYPLLCTGDTRTWKGTATIEAAAAIVGVPLEQYGPKNLSQSALGHEYDAARVFAVGSEFEGFGQPGLEALACGVPLVTTDNGGCHEYAIDAETALVVPSGDPQCMADAITALLEDRSLALRLSRNGLELVAQDFDWERQTDTFAEILDGVCAGTALAPPPPRPKPPIEPELSVVVLAWDNLHYTEDFVESVRLHTDVSHELIIVDNGSAPLTAHYAEVAADTTVLNETNFGFARGMNQGTAVARGSWIAFCNNDTVLPADWAGRLLETAAQYPNAGIIVPALTNARNAATVRTEPGNDIEVLRPFSAPPAAVVYVLRADVVEALGGWGEEYEIASGEDVDLAFKVWVNGLDIVYDQRVLVDHVGKGSASRLDDWAALWARNRQHFLDKWQDPTSEVPRLDACDPASFQRNRQIASATAQWMERYFHARDRAAWAVEGRLGPRLRRRGALVARTSARSLRRVTPPGVRGKLYRGLSALPAGVARPVRGVVDSLR